MDEKKQIEQLKQEVHNLKEQLESSIPRRRVRRVFKEFKKMLEQDINTDTKKDIDILKEFITKIEKDGESMAGQEIKTAIEHLISVSLVTKDTDEEINYIHDNKVLNLMTRMMARQCSTPIYDSEWIWEYWRMEAEKGLGGYINE